MEWVVMCNRGDLHLVKVDKKFCKKGAQAMVDLHAIMMGYWRFEPFEVLSRL